MFVEQVNIFEIKIFKRERLINNMNKMIKQMYTSFAQQVN